MKLYLDTEFTDLHAEAKLISIALVASDDNYFYAELTDTYSISDCSDFVLGHVLPYLLEGDFKMTLAQCSVELESWIRSLNEECVLVLDNPEWDLPHLRRVLGDFWPNNLKKYEYIPIYIPSDIKEDIFLYEDLVEHRAIDDARAMMIYDRMKS